MLLPISKIKHLNSVNHEGKIVIIVTDKDGKLYYTVRQEGHEDNYDKTTLKGWEDWETLPIPHQTVDESVRAIEEKEWSDTRNGFIKPIIRSIYQTSNTTAVAPVQLISGVGHLYVFRQQKSGKLAVDRFVLDGMTNKLVPKLQVRYKRSRQKYEPLRKDAAGKDVMDSYDFRDANNIPFLEPSTELSILPATNDGWFSVVLLPTKDADQFRWHIFIYNIAEKQLELWSMASSQNGLFEIRDQDGKDGIVKRILNLEEGVDISQGPVATKYDVQFERMTEAGPQLLRDKIRVMLVAPTTKEGMAMAINFSADPDGFLSEFGEAEKPQTLDSFTRQILLPISSLDEIKSFGQDKEAGTIEAINKGKEDEVWIETDPESLPEMGNQVEISGTKNFNGLHQVVKATKNTILIEEVVNKIGDERYKLGKWEQKLDPNESLLFDGMVTAFRKMAGNTIRITSPKHGLKKGDQLQLIGTTDIDGVFGVQDVRKDSFSLNLKWNNSQIINIQSKPRRGIHFDADGDAVQTPLLPLSNPTLDTNIARTVSAWVYPEDMSSGTQLIAGNDYGLLQLILIDGTVHASMNIKQRGSDQLETILLADEAKIKMEWTHYAATFQHDETTDNTSLVLLRDGAVVVQKEVAGKPNAINNSALLFDGSGKAMLYADTTDLIDFSQSDFTMECWVKTEKGGPVISKLSSQKDQQGFDFKNLFIDESGLVTFTFRGDVIVTSDSKVNDNQWHHLAVTASHRQNSVSLYVDGNVENTVYGVLSMKWKAPAPLSQMNVRGRITEENGKPVARATVVVKGTNRGVLTDFDGNFMLAAGKGDILIISYSGYNTQEIPVGQHYTINVQLHNISESNENFLIGAVASGEHHDKRFNGAIDEVKIWKKSRTAQEIMAQKNLRLPGNELNLLAYWSFAQQPKRTVISEERKHLFSFASTTANSIELHTEHSFALTNAPPIQIAKWEEQYWLGGTNQAGNDFRNFRGKLSSIQIWDKALSEKTVRDSMHLELRGTEDGLAVYYPMGGIIENEVIDFSINKLHGTVYGDPYYSERTLNSSILGDQPVTMYQNDELIAISQGAKYHERFEFRLLDENGNPVAPQNIAVKPAFEFYLWGKSSRSADDKIDDGFTNVVQTFNALGDDGWYEANCWFNTPDTIRLIRLFAIQNVQGAREVWQHMEVRKHSLKFIADAITLATQVDTLPELKALADPGVDLGDLPRLEQLQRRYLKEKNRLEGRLEKIKTFSNDEKEIASRIESLKGNNGLIAKTDKELKEAYNNPLHYYCKIYVQEHQKLFVLPPGESTGELQLYREDLPKGTFIDSTLTVGTDAKMKWWEIKKYVGNRYLIFPYDSPSDTARPNMLRYNKVDTYRPDLYFGTEFIEPLNKTTTGLTAFIFDLGYAFLYKKGNRLAIDTTNKTRWTIERVNPVTLSPSGKVYIENLEAKVNAYKEELITLEERLEWQDRLDKLIQKLEPLEVQINQLISQFNSNVTDQQNPEEMPLIANANDLPTRAAYLSFVKAASRLNIMESCEGNLILSYFDIQGRMRQTVFDATADSRNSTFEQWLPETMKSCLDFSHNDNSVVALNSPIALGENWTIEFWFSYPLPNTGSESGQINKDHIFISGIGQKPGKSTLSSPAMIKNTERSGLKIQELGILTSEQIDHLGSEPFLGTGYNMESLSHGWHHMAVQGTGMGSNSTASFFINGKKVGNDIRTQYLINHPDIEEKKLKQFQFNYTDQISGFGNLIPKDQMTNPFTWKMDFKVGRMAEVRLWDIVLSPEEIEMNSRSYLSGNEPGLVAYYPLSEGANAVARNHAAYYSLEQDIDATIENARWVPSTAPIGHPGDKAVFFDGEDDVIKFEKPVQLKESSSLALWFKSSNEGKSFFGSSISAFKLFNFDNSKSRIIEHDPTQTVFSAIIFDSVLLVGYVNKVFTKDNNGKYTVLNDSQQDYIGYKLGSAIDSSWHHLSFSIDKGTFQLIYDGKEILPVALPGEPVERKKIDNWATDTLPLKVGSGFLGQLAGFQIWDRALTTEEIQKIRFRRQLGSEPGLLLYCPLDKVTEDKRVINFSSDNYGKTHQTDTHLMEATFTNDLPIGLDANVVAEYPTVAFDPETNQQTAMMWRFLAMPKVDKLHLLTHKRIELLEQVWIGNGQFDPTLLGFIEGAPPVPSENLTVEDDYSDATSVMLSVGKNTEYSWERTQDIFTELDMSAKIGMDVETHTGGGLGVISLFKMQVKGLAGIAANFRYGAQNASTISSSSSLNLNDSLSLRGYKEDKAAFENIGSRFLPKNIGYALVVSSMADIFIIRLKRSKKMVSYKVLPLEGIPPQVNTITFMINPAYSLNGSLDGQVGTNAADDRFYRQVPEMRSQFGSKYPASYLKLEQAIFLQSAIDKMDKERESYFQNFNSRLVDEMALDRELNNDSATPKKINVKDNSGEVVVDEDEFEEAGDEAEEKTKEMQEEAGQSLDKYQAMAESGSKAAGLSAWQTKMEKLLLKAGKQNIVNSYVWDADGGLHASSESFASTITHSIGGSFSFAGSLGMELEIAMGFAAELGIAAGVGVELTMSKSESTSQEIGLEVDMSGMEHRGITDDKDYPLAPGEKVDRYRFSSFFLEGNTNHFHDFFNEVVDPEWLISNDEEARALRMIDTSKANKAWRILHRVTYVERPALMGFGRDTRPLLGNEASNDMSAQIEKIDGNLKDVERNTDQLKRKIAHLEDALELAKGQNEQMAGQLEQIIQMLKQK